MRRVLRAIFLLSVVTLAAPLASCSLQGPVDKSLLTGKPCQPPCWQRLVPGVSTQEEVLGYIKRSYYVGYHSVYLQGDTTYIEWQSTQSGRGGATWNGFEFKSRLLTVISIYLDYELTLQHLVQGYGAPEKFTAYPGDPHTMNADVNLFYPALGLAARLESSLSDRGYELRPDTRVVRVWYFQPTSLDGLLDLADSVPFPHNKEAAQTMLQDWQGYGFIQLIP